MGFLAQSASAVLATVVIAALAVAFALLSNPLAGAAAVQGVADREAYRREQAEIRRRRGR